MKLTSLLQLVNKVEQDGKIDNLQQVCVLCFDLLKAIISDYLAVNFNEKFRNCLQPAIRDSIIGLETGLL